MENLDNAQLVKGGAAQMECIKFQIHVAEENLRKHAGEARKMQVQLDSVVKSITDAKQTLREFEKLQEAHKNMKYQMERMYNIHFNR